MIKCLRVFSTFGGFKLGFKVSLFFIGSETHACRHFDILLPAKPILSKVYLDIELIIPRACQIKENQTNKTVLVGCTEPGCPTLSIMISMNY